MALVYVALDSPDLNVERVAERVKAGGHHIDEPVIRRRYEAAIGRLPSALALADTTIVFDNSGLRPLALLTVESGLIVGNSLDENNPLHLRLADAVAIALQVERKAVLISGTNI